MSTRKTCAGARSQGNSGRLAVSADILEKRYHSFASIICSFLEGKLYATFWGHVVVQKGIR